MKILFVAMTESVHTARWISQLAGEDWDLHLFPSIDQEVVHDSITNVAIHNRTYGGAVRRSANEPIRNGVSKKSRLGALSAHIGTQKEPQESDLLTRLVYVIDRIKPDIIHSLEFQHAGYLTLAARAIIEEKQPGSFPTWMVTNWGSDIYLFGRQEEHRERIRGILAHCDYYFCECERDVELAKDYGLKGKVLPVYPVAGGLDLTRLDTLRQPGPVSQRRTVTLKGYQHFAGRALVGVRALEMCADALHDYKVAIYSAFDDVRATAEEVAASTGIEIEFIPAQRTHAEMLALFGRSRICIGLSISDGISNSMLETIAMGAFPIQSYTSCADEWVQDGETGLLVPPEDPVAVAEALRRALADDALVDRAAELNGQVCAERLDSSKIAPHVVSVYREIAYEHGFINVLEFPAHPQPRVQNSDRPLVSILTPTYNRADYLRETLDSVLNQTYPNIEYVVLDDGSNDNTVDILMEYDDRLRWESHPNMGETRTVNKGFRMLTGDYVMIVNSDDPILPDLVEKAVSILESHPELLMIYPDWYVINERSEVINTIQAWDYDYHEMIRISGCIPGPGALMRAEALKLESGRDEKYHYVADYEYWLRLGRHGAFQRIPEFLATHRHHATSAGVSQWETLSVELIQLMQSFFKQPGLPKSIRRLRCASLSATYYDAAYRCRENPVLARRYALRAFLYRPRLWTRANIGQYSRHPNAHILAMLAWPKTMDRLHRHSHPALAWRLWRFFRHRIYPFFRFRVWGYFRHRIYPFFRFRAWGYFRIRIVRPILNRIRRLVGNQNRK